MIEQAKLGVNGPLEGRPGYGAMLLAGLCGDVDENEAIKTLSHAIDSGMMIDSADACAAGHNESLIGKALAACAEEAFIATRFGIVFDENENATELPTGWGFSL